MLTNIVDRRSNPNLWKSVDAVLEATSNDNVRDSQTPHDNTDDVGQSCLYRTGITVGEAVRLADSLPDQVTLYLYDLGEFGDTVDF